MPFELFCFGSLVVLSVMCVAGDVLMVSYFVLSFFLRGEIWD